MYCKHVCNFSINLGCNKSISDVTDIVKFLAINSTKFITSINDIVKYIFL